MYTRIVLEPKREITPYAVVCNHNCEDVFVCLSEAEYDAQMCRPDSTWRCPVCRQEAMWSDWWHELGYDLWTRRGSPDHSLENPTEFPLDGLYTCYYCDQRATCSYVDDPYNTNGACLANK